MKIIFGVVDFIIFIYGTTWCDTIEHYGRLLIIMLIIFTINYILYLIIDEESFKKYKV